MANSRVFAAAQALSSSPPPLVTSPMANRISLLLDTMITVVDEGFSTDGILSVPELGLEDVAYRPGLAGLSDRAMDAVHAARAVISRMIPRVFRRSPPPTPVVDKPNPRDSGISTIDDKTFLSKGEKLPRRADDRHTKVLPLPSVQEKLPRKSNQDLRGSDVNQDLPANEGSTQIPPRSDTREKLPRKSKQYLREQDSIQELPADQNQDSLGPGTLERSPRKGKQDLQDSGAEDQGPAQDPLVPDSLGKSPRKSKLRLRFSGVDQAPGGPVQDPPGPSSLGRSHRRREQGLRDSGADQGLPAPEQGPAHPHLRLGALERQPRISDRDLRGQASPASRPDASDEKKVDRG